MKQSILNVDNGALDAPVYRGIQPRDIGVIQEAHAEVGHQNLLPLQAISEQGEQVGAPDPEDGLDPVMANATDLQMFRDNEGYRYGQVDADSDSDVPEDYSSDSEDD